MTALFLVHRPGLVEHLLHLRGQQGVLRGLQQRVLRQHGQCFALGGVEGAGVVHQVGNLQCGQTVLSAAKKVADAFIYNIVSYFGRTL